MTQLESSFRLRPPKLPDHQTLSLIAGALVHEVTGSVAGIVGENVEIIGMNAPLGAICELPKARPPVQLQVVGFRQQRLIASPLQRLTHVSAGDIVRLVDDSSKLRVGPSLCGRIVDAFGNPIDGQPLPKGLRYVHADQPPPNSLDRPPIDTPLQTGVRAIDAMLTCGRGQRLGIFCRIGSRQKHAAGHAGARYIGGPNRDRDGWRARPRGEGVC